MRRERRRYWAAACITEECNTMRKFILGLVAAVLLSSSVGCFLPAYSADPTRRAQQLIFTSEDLRNFLNEWERIWFLDMPSHMTPQRVHGGII
jgi:hypothetical protein